MEQAKSKVSCIIPAFNEAPRIASILAVVAGHPLVDEVIVIDDGSTDGTADMLRSFKGVTPVILEKNGGKSAAVMRGIQLARNDTVMLIDADLINLQPENITALVEPVTSGAVDMTISMRKNSLLLYRLLGNDFVSGERVFHKRLIPDLSALGRLKGFELEVYLNKLVVAGHLRIRVIRWDNVICLLKYKKFGFWEGWWRDAKMTWEIVRYMTLRGVIRQYRGLLALRR